MATDSTTNLTTTNQAAQNLSANLPNYANEKDPSWEDVIAMVVIPGIPNGIHNAAGNLDVILSRIDQAQSSLHQLSTGLQSWQGAAGEAYRNHLNELTQVVQTTLQTHKPIVQELHQAADNVQQAMNKIPIPDELVDETIAAQQRYAQTGQVDPRFHGGWFGDLLFPGFLNIAGDIFGFLTFGLSDKASDMLRDFLSDGDDKAKAAYQELAGQHQASVSTMQNLQSVMASGSPTTQAFNPYSPPPPGAPAQGPGIGTMPSTPGGGGGGPSVDPEAWKTPSGTTLAGAGGAGGISGIGGGGIGSGGMGLSPIGASGGAGTVGAGAGGIGGGASPLTPGIRAGGTTSAGAMKAGMGGGMGGMGAMGGAHGGSSGGTRAAGSSTPVKGPGSKVAGGGAAGAGAGGARGGTGMMGAGHGAGGEGSATDHNTWLQEDEDPWGTDSDAPPPVLGG
jgi:uncharacterized protein YukE